MKVTKWVEFSTEVEIDIDGADAVAAIIGDTDGWTPDALIKRAINNVGSLIRNLGPDVVASLTPEARAIIRTFCLEQAERFR